MHIDLMREQVKDSLKDLFERDQIDSTTFLSSLQLIESVKGYTAKVQEDMYRKILSSIIYETQKQQNSVR